MHKRNAKFGFGATGVIFGALCVALIWAIEVYGPGSNTATGSGALYADGAVVMEVERPLLPLIARAAFYTCLVSTLFGTASIMRREALSVSLGAIAFGIAPILIYTQGIVFAFVLYNGLMVLIAGFELYRVLIQHNKQKQADA
ncbi:hypothetical protein PHACT_10060 [Pseudohongiella acticola]|uniref:Uncharacterized protein n=1 Tax=Pseudohongiella acticola TaxID=1524254 RepID=A0A1E8CLY5_9GAMM|nr:hypothetical protein PHACT_10060 [Pseudohongiella acticola]